MRPLLASLVLLAACDRPQPQEEPKTLLSAGAPSSPLTIVNQCSADVWIMAQPNAGSPELPDGIMKLPAKGGSHGYTIPAAGWAGRFWPKTGCDASGQSCTTGQAVPPCPPTGCQPPADTKVEFFFPAAGAADRPYYDVSLVDGYSTAMSIKPSASGGACVPTSCKLDLAKCPSSEIEGIGDLRIEGPGGVGQCFAPCKKWTWPTPLGDGKTEQDAVGAAMCCPNPPVSSEQCNAGDVVKTQYVKLVHEECPSAYSFAFDDQGGSHDCPNGTSFTVTLCP
jgi:hypothetical protein